MVQQLISPQVVLRPQFIPGNFSFGIAIGIQGIDLSIVNKIKINILDTHKNILQDSGWIEVPPTRSDIPETLPEKYRGFVMNMDIRNLVIREEGEYSFLIYVNEKLIGTQYIPIFKALV